MIGDLGFGICRSPFGHGPVRAWGPFGHGPVRACARSGPPSLIILPLPLSTCWSYGGQARSSAIALFLSIRSCRATAGRCPGTDQGALGVEAFEVLKP